ncbi:hypothetical protein [Intestinimonas butyriciproducens]|uniref:hypothetical protein n=1 Tax=Intestinimonas butyriciproducens TaxID=1297617 RepID=UPI00117AA5D3|nr:hypothetical protein [Intestinimonas butyriciproducens]
MGELYLKLYDHDGRAEIIADTMENTSLLLKVNGETYPVRSCAIKSILERARISGHALNKVSKSIFTQILNYCMDVASGDSLIKVADDKVSAVHAGPEGLRHSGDSSAGPVCPVFSGSRLCGKSL